MTEQRLTDAEFDRLADLLKGCGGKRAMNIEMLDGFLAALICGPETVAPSEYLPEIWGGDETEEPLFESKSTLQEFLSLIMRYWNATGRTLQSGEVFLPVLLNDESGIVHGNDWASGFIRGIAMRQESWLALMDDDENVGALVPVLALAHEHDPDPEMRPYKVPIGSELREKLIVGLAAGVTRVYRYFAAERKLEARTLASAKTVRRGAPKVGRNDPCPCGSGKKFKHCCDRVTLH
jgi:uncharacterized protein